MKKKVWDVTVKDNPNKVVMGENDEFYTSDTEAYLIFNLQDKFFRPRTATLTLENRNDGSLKSEEIAVVDGVIEWEMPERYIEHFGNWQGQLVYEDTKDGQPELYTSAPFSFVVNAHIGDKKKPSLVEIENWEKFIREGTELIETWEDMEDLRQANEAQRQANYQELLDTGVLQTNINTKLEQLEEEYAPKLTEVAAQLAQKTTKGDIGLDDLNKNKFQLDETWFSDEVKQQWAGNTPIHATPADESITTKKLANKAVTATKLVGAESRRGGINLFNKDDILTGGYYDRFTRQWEPDAGMISSNFIPVEPGVSYRASDVRNVVFWDKDKNFISGVFQELYTAPRDTAYITQQVTNNMRDTFMITKESDWPDSYVPYEEGVSIGEKWDISGAKLSIKDHSIPGVKLVGVDKTNSGINLFDKDDVLLGGYYDRDTGQWEPLATMISSNFIRVEPGVRYRASDKRNVVFWDKDKNFISGVFHELYTAPRDTAYITQQVTNNMRDTFMITKESDWPDSYVPFEEGYLLAEEWKVLNAEYKDGNSARQTVFKDLFLRVPTPYDDGSADEWATHQTTHPSIVQFDDGWNGWKYWMAHTPYPHANEPLENPCVAVSNDGIKWEEPEGISNPLVEIPTGNNHNSDTHMFYNDTSKKLEIWYRQVLRPEDEEIIYRIISSDGINWGAPELMIHSSASNILQLISPSVIFDNGVYKMWVMRNYVLAYMTSENGKDWSTPVNVLSDGERIGTWHSNVVLYDDKLHLLNHVLPGTIKYSYSELGNETIFSKQVDVHKWSGNPWDLDGDRLYRASPIFTPTNVILIHGIGSQQNDWLLGAVSGPDMYNLKPITQKAFDFYGVE